MQDPTYNNLSSGRRADVILAPETHACVTFCTYLPQPEDSILWRSLWNVSLCVCPGASEFGVCQRAVKGLGSGWSEQQPVLLDGLTCACESCNCRKSHSHGSSMSPGGMVGVYWAVGRPSPISREDLCLTWWFSGLWGDRFPHLQNGFALNEVLFWN